MRKVTKKNEMEERRSCGGDRPEKHPLCQPWHAQNLSVGSADLYSYCICFCIRTEHAVVYCAIRCGVLYLTSEFVA